MNTYFIRTTDRQTLMSLGVAIGLFTAEGTLVDPHVGIWDEIGTIYRPTGNVVNGVPETAPVADEAGTPYWHANLMLFELSLGDMARAAYAANPTDELGAALASIPSYFVCDESGAPVTPGQPARVFA